MGKRKIKQRKSLVKKTVVPGINQLMALFNTIRRLQITFIMLMLTMLAVVSVSERVRNNVHQTPEIIFIPYMSVWFILTYLNYKTGQRAGLLKSQYKQQTTEYLAIAKTKIIITSISSGLCILGLFYLSGSHIWLISVLGKLLPRASNTLLNWLASIPGWVVGGIIGNIAYKHFEKIRQRLLHRKD